MNCNLCIIECAIKVDTGFSTCQVLVQIVIYYFPCEKIYKYGYGFDFFFFRSFRSVVFFPFDGYHENYYYYSALLESGELSVLVLK